MPYYTRVLAVKEESIPLQELAELISENKNTMDLEIEDGDEAQWQQLLLKHRDDSPIAVIERNSTSEELGKDEIIEFLEEIDALKPRSAVKWLKKFLPKVKVIYAFQILSGADERDGWKAIRAVQEHVWNKLGGILQADGEGFSNEDGYHIVWQFSDSVTGPWYMAVKKPCGGWAEFKMELGDIEQRQAFWEGDVPKGADRL